MQERVLEGRTRALAHLALTLESGERRGLKSLIRPRLPDVERRILSRSERREVKGVVREWPRDIDHLVAVLEQVLNEPIEEEIHDWRDHRHAYHIPLQSCLDCRVELVINVLLDRTIRREAKRRAS